MANSLILTSSPCSQRPVSPSLVSELEHDCNSRKPSAEQENRPITVAQTSELSSPMGGSPCSLQSIFQRDPMAMPVSCFTRLGRNEQVRTFDQDGFCRRAMAICFRSASETEVLVVSSSSKPNRWVIPGGGINPDELASACALREAGEEAGVIGSLQRFVGVYESSAGVTPCRTAAMVIHVESLSDSWCDNTEMGRQRCWMPVERALEELRFKPYQQAALKEAISKH